MIPPLYHQDDDRADVVPSQVTDEPALDRPSNETSRSDRDKSQSVDEHGIADTPDDEAQAEPLAFDLPEREDQDEDVYPAETGPDSAPLASILPWAIVQDADGRVKKIATAMSLAMLPVLAVGTITYFVGKKIFDEQALWTDAVVATQDIEARRQQHLDLFAFLLMGTGVSALSVGGVAGFWAQRAFRKTRQLAIAEMSAQLEQQRAEQERVLQDAIGQFQTITHPDDLLQAAVTLIREVLECDRVLAYALVADQQAEVIAESVHLGQEHLLGTRTEAPAMLIDAEPLTARSTVVSVVKGPVPVLLATLQVGDDPLLMTAQPDQGEWLPAEIELFRQLTTQVCHTLNYLHHMVEFDHLQIQFQDEVQWRERVQASAELMQTAELDNLYALAVEEVRQVLECDRAVYCAAAPKMGLVLTESIALGWSKLQGQTVAGLQDREALIQILPDIEAGDLPPDVQAQLRLYDVKASMAVPVCHCGQLHGFLIAHQCTAPRAWLPTEANWLKQFAQQVGHAFDRLKLAAQKTVSTTSTSELSHLLVASQSLLTDLKAEAAKRSTAMTAAVEQLQSLTDASRTILVKAERAMQAGQAVSQGVQLGHQQVNQSVDVNAEFQETIAGTITTVQQLQQSIQQIVHTISQMHDWATQMSQTAVQLSIVSGQAERHDPSALLTIAEAVMSFSQNIAEATTQLQPLAQVVATDTQAIATSMEIGSEQLIVGNELTRETRQQLNRLAQSGDQLHLVLSQMAEVDPSQTIALTYQPVQEVSQMVGYTLEKTAELSQLLQTLETVIQVQSIQKQHGPLP